MGWTLLSVAKQVARLVMGPRKRKTRRPPPPASSGVDRVGHCPACRAFIRLGAAGPDGTAPCPECGQAIEGVEPLA
jgi:transcription elongation factor Elf1